MIKSKDGMFGEVVITTKKSSDKHFANTGFETKSGQANSKNQSLM